MKIIAKIIRIVSEYTHVDVFSLMEKRDKESSNARGMVCHIVKTEYPKNIGDLASMFGLTDNAIYAASASFAKKITDDATLLDTYNDVRDELGLEKFCTKKEIPASVHIFGWRWTDEENQQIAQAIQSSNEFFKKYGKIGRQPIEDGMVFSKKQNESKPKRSWYNPIDNKIYNQ